MNYYLAIDQGTHSSRAILYDEAGELIANQVEPVELFYQKNRHVEQSPLDIVNSTHKVISRLLDCISTTIRQQITACGIACQRSTIVICDHHAKPLSSAISWQDTRGKSYLKQLSLSATQVQDISGLPLSPHYAASKFLWLLDHHPPIQNVASDEIYLAPLISFLLLHLSQSTSFVVDHSHAQRMQLMDIQQLDWSQTLVSAFQIPQACLPQCKPMCDDYGLLLNTNIPITAVCGDQNAALFGSGELNEETALINIGSGAFVLRKLPIFKKSKNLLTGVAYSSSTRKEVDYLREATINGAGNALSWFHQQWSSQEIEKWQQQLPIWLDTINEPPLFINTVGGLGSPWWSNPIAPYFDDEIDDNENIKAKSVAIIESIVFLIQDNLHIMIKEHPLTRLKLSGGLSQLDGLCQKLANLSELPVQRLVDKETTARGIAWLCSGENTAWPVTNRISPQASTAQEIEFFNPVDDAGLQGRYLRFHSLIKELTEHE